MPTKKKKKGKSPSSTGYTEPLNPRDAHYFPTSSQHTFVILVKQKICI